MKITTNPNTEVSTFGYTEAGKYDLRIVKAELKEGPKAPYISWEHEFVDANIKATDGKSKVGHVFDNTTLKTDAQFSLRALSDAVGLPWGAELDTDEMVGLEFQANVGVDTYDGVMKNIVKRYIPKK